MKKLLSMLLAITMLVSMMIVVPASAETTDDNVLKLIEFTPECDKVKCGGKFVSQVPIFTTDKARVGNYSVHYVGGPSDGVKYFQYIVDVQYEGYKWNDEDYLKMWVYNAGDECKLQYNPGLDNGNVLNKPTIELIRGWNLVSIRLGGEKYPNDTFNIYQNIYLEGYAVQGTEGKNLDLYFGEPWIEKIDTYNTLTATPSVENGATDVSSQIDEYVINFSNPLNNPEKTAKAVTFKQGENEVKGTVITAGADYVKIVPGRILPETTYTVSIAGEELYDITGNELQTETFTFTTAEADEVIVPTLTVLSPENGSTCSNPIKITIGVEADDHTASVKVFDDKNELGETGIEAVTVDGSEWQVDVATFATEGEHTITVKAYDVKGEELASVESTFTVVEVGPFNVSGIYEDAYIALNEKTTVKVTTDALENDIEKVVFVDGETEAIDAEAPYEWNLSNNPGAHTLEIYVHDIYGGKRLAKTIKYTAIMGDPIATTGQDFEGAAPTITASDATLYSISDCANLDGKALKVTGSVDVSNIDPGTSVAWNEDIKVIYQEFDVYQTTATGRIIVKFGHPGYIGSHGSVTLIADKLKGKKTHIRIIYDIVNRMYSVYQGDEVISEGVLFAKGMQYWTGANKFSKEAFAYALDLDYFTEERPGYFDNFKTTAYSDLAEGKVALKWNNASIVENNQAASVPTSVCVVNNTGSTLNLINVFAEYNPMEVLVNAYVVAFDAPTGQKTESEYVMTDLTAGNTVKMYTLDAETLKPYTVPSK